LIYLCDIRPELQALRVNLTSKLPPKLRYIPFDGTCGGTRARKFGGTGWPFACSSSTFAMFFSVNCRQKGGGGGRLSVKTAFSWPLAILSGVVCIC
jgi:hypothetical protein